MKNPLLTLLCLVSLNHAGCHSEHHAPHVAQGKFPVTNPVRRATELDTPYVCQISAIQHIELRALERGYLEGIFVDEGQRVRAGQKMFQIMPMLYQAELQKAEAEADFVKIEYDNTKILADGAVVSPNELALAKAKLDKAHAELALAKVHRGLTEVRAPFDGIMGRFHVRRGSLVDEGELLTTLSDNRTVWVYFNVSEAEYLDYASRSKGAESMTVRLLMANGEPFDQPGKVETIEADFDNETGNIAFRATFPNPEGLLRHGETGTILVSTRIDDALLIPQKATFEILDKRFVFVVDDKNTVRAREIRVAAEVPHLFVVGRGLSERDRILVEGLRKVRDGLEVELEFQEPSAVFASLEVPAN